MVLAVLRNSGALSLEQRRSLEAPTGQTVKAYCVAKQLPLKSVTLDVAPSATLHFVDCDEKTSGKVLLYFHGGGYVHPMSAKAHLPMVHEYAKAANASVALLEYSLSPEVPYPGQLVQAVEALRYLLRSRGPEDVILGGDSAGGNLVLSLVAHLREPCPYADPIEMHGTLAGMLLISPWVGLDYTADSYRTNAERDYLSRKAMQNFNKLWKPKSDEVWCNPLSRPATFWRHIAVNSTLILAGSWEVFLDDIVSFAGRTDGTRTQLVLCPKDVHVGCGIDYAVTGELRSLMARSILEWCRTI